MFAPVEDHTDFCFRSICYGADLTFTELVRLDAPSNNKSSSLKGIKLHNDTPTVPQLIGQKEKTLEKFLSTFTPSKGFSGFNINVGCPAPKFVNQGLGCARIKRICGIKRIIHMITGCGYSVNIKMRLGLNQREKEKKVYLNLINEVNADFFCGSC